MSSFSNKGQVSSQMDPGGVAKNVHDYWGQSIRTLDSRSVVNSYYSHFTATYDVNNNPTLVSYFLGTKAQVVAVGCVADVNGSLSGKYFTIYSAPDDQPYYVWFNVDGGSVNPAVSGAVGIEVPISENDSAQVIAATLNFVINSLFKSKFSSTRLNAVVTIQTVLEGLVTSATDTNTGFVLQTTPGEEQLVSNLTISYSGTDPIYQGQVLKGYYFDIYGGKFLKTPPITVTVDPGQGKTLITEYNEIDSVVQGITESLLSYTASAAVYLQKIEVSGTNIAQYELTVDGQTVDKKRTYFAGGLNSVFQFDSGLEISAGSEVIVYVVHDRPDNGDFNARIQLLE